MSRHRAPSKPPWRRILALVAGLVVVVLAVLGAVRLLTGDDAPGTADDGAGNGGDGVVATDTGTATAGAPAGCDGAEELVVVTTAAMAAPLEEAAAGAASDCLTVEVQARESAEVAQQLADAAGGGAASDADVWVPDSTLYVELLAAQGVPVEAGDVVATSPVVLAGPAQLVGRAPEGAAWPDLIGSELPLKGSSPRQDAPSLLTLLSAQAAFAGDAEGGEALAQTMVRLGQDLRPADELLEMATSGEQVLFATSEQVVHASGGTLGALVPEGGLGTLSFPVVTVPGSDASAEAVAALTEALLSPEGQQALAAAGFRPGEDGPAPGVAGVPDVVPALADQFTAEEVTAATESWARITQAQRMLAILDVSGSMREEVGDDTRIGIATGAAEEALGLMRSQSQVGLWEFSTDRGPAGEDHRQLIPVRALDAVSEGRTHREALLEAVRSITAETVTGDTALYDTILAAYQLMQDEFDPGYVNSVVLLTDGVNDNPAGGLGEDELIAELERLADPDRPVTLVLIGMGPSVDGGALQRIAESTGGRAYVAEDPADIGPVFIDAVMNRQR